MPREPASVSTARNGRLTLSALPENVYTIATGNQEHDCADEQRTLTIFTMFFTLADMVALPP